MNEQIRKHAKGRLLVILDKREVFEDDPGQGTPAMVYLKPAGIDNSGHPRSCDGSATWWCAVGEGEVDGYRLSAGEVNWLESLECEIDEFLYQGVGR